MKAFSKHNSITGFDFHETDDTLEAFHVRDDVEVVQQLVVIEVNALKGILFSKSCVVLSLLLISVVLPSLRIELKGLS